MTNVNNKMITYFMQMLTLFCIVLASLINLSMSVGDQRLWLTLLSMSLGCILPTPKISNKNDASSRTPSRTTSMNNDIKNTFNSSDVQLKI